VFWNALIEIYAMGHQHQPSFLTVLSSRVTPPTEGCRLRKAAGASGANGSACCLRLCRVNSRRSSRRRGGGGTQIFTLTLVL
jgi:hypothetical protein